MLKQAFETTEEARNAPIALPAQAETAATDALVVEAEDPLVASVRKRMKRYSRTLFAAILYCGAGTLAFALISEMILLSSVGGVAMRYILPLAFVIFGTIIAAIVHPRKLLIAGKQDIEKVAAQQEVQTVGTLVDMLSLEKEIKVTHAQQGLIALLPQLRPEHSHLLNIRQRGILRRCLAMNIELVLYRDVSRLFKPVSLANPANRRAIELRVAIMEALANVGTQEDIAVVEKWAKIEPESEAQTVLKSAAERCLPLLQSRVAALSDKNTLLRASSAGADGAGVLLRPAAATHSEPAEELLRPTIGE